MPLLPKIIMNLRQFLADDRGAAGIEFLMTLPLLVGTMVFTAEYGNALRTKMVLNTATADITRLLARAPLENDPVNTGGLRFYQHFEDEALAILEARMGGTVTLSTSVTRVATAVELRAEPVLITVQTDIGLSMPLLGFINDTIQTASFFSNPDPNGNGEALETLISISSELQATWVGGSDFGAADCSNINRELDQCNVTPPGST